jgi:hypothetical protein
MAEKISSWIMIPSSKRYSLKICARPTLTDSVVAVEAISDPKRPVEGDCTMVLVESLIGLSASSVGQARSLPRHLRPIEARPNLCSN